jgi:hypothetical protein
MTSLLTSPDELYAYSLGWLARHDGQPVEACPYEGKDEFTAYWILGFDAADGWEHADHDSTPIVAVGVLS